MKRKLAVIALGGNALLRFDQAGTIDEQEQNTFDSLENLVFLLKRKFNLVITHGNGPQVGNILLKSDAGETVYGIPQMPVDVCVADSQGGIGYMIERMLRNVLRKHNIAREVVTLVTMVEVNKDDPAFMNPSKRIGKTYLREETERLKNEKGWEFREETKGDTGWRRVVPSPEPIRIVNEDVIKYTAETGIVVVAVGGGGIPVYIDENMDVRPSECVIDKDLASSLLASRIKADEFYILTDVPFVYLNYLKSSQEKVEYLNYEDGIRYLNEGHFPEGTMAPKIKACLRFIEKGGQKSVITEAFKLSDKRFGTKITREYED